MGRPGCQEELGFYADLWEKVHRKALEGDDSPRFWLEMCCLTTSFRRGLSSAWSLPHKSALFQNLLPPLKALSGIFRTKFRDALR